MAIYRGVGGPGDATTDVTSEASVAAAAASAAARALGRGAELGRAPALLICKRKEEGVH